MVERRAVSPRTPVIVGVGQFTNRTDEGAELLEPVDLIAEAVARAAKDAGAPALIPAIDVIGCSRIVLWRYRDPGRLVAERTGAGEVHTWYPDHGGNTPQSFLNRMASAIQDGTMDVGLICGGEAGMARKVAKRNGIDLEWTRQADDVQADWSEPEGVGLLHPAELAHGVALPTQAYPLFETAMWHESGRTLDEHVDHLGRLWAGYASVAADNPNAWDRATYRPADITSATEDNRYVGWPYTRRMVSNPDVDMASAVIICSAETADRLGVPRDRWVFLHAGTDGKDPHLSNRPSLTGSAAIRVAGRRVLDLAGVGMDDLAHVDVYSCFPSAVQMACTELGLPMDRTLTTWGGLCFGGGPWNNPVGHAIATMVERLRVDAGAYGLVTANGGNIQKHAFGVYSTEPPVEGRFLHEHPQAAIDASGSVELVEDAGGGLEATIEGWTVMYERGNVPIRAHATCRLADGRRIWAHSNAEDVIAAFTSADQGGRPVRLGPDHGIEL